MLEILSPTRAHAKTRSAMPSRARLVDAAQDSHAMAEFGPASND